MHNLALGGRWKASTPRKAVAKPSHAGPENQPEQGRGRTKSRVARPPHNAAENRPVLSARQRATRSHPRSDAPLRSVEYVVLRLVHLDPRLTTKPHRDRLFLLVQIFLPQRSPHRIGRALAKLRDLQSAAAIDTDAFTVGAAESDPKLNRCRRLFDDLVRGSQPGIWPAGRSEIEWPRFARLLGHVIHP